MEDSTRDIILLVEGTGSIAESTSAIGRLRHSKNSDVRVIAAHGCVIFPTESFEWLVSWIKGENDPEVRGWLYIALSKHFSVNAIKLLKLIETNFADMGEEEQVFLTASLSLALSSRSYFVKLITYFFSKDQDVSRLSIRLSKILVHEGDESDKFIRLLETELYGFVEN